MSKAQQTIPCARTQCPECGESTVLDLAPLLISPRVDYFRCYSCLGWWMVPKGESEPVTRIVCGDLEELKANVNKAV